jgi:hypothetical protein
MLKRFLHFLNSTHSLISLFFPMATDRADHDTALQVFWVARVLNCQRPLLSVASDGCKRYIMNGKIVGDNVISVKRNRIKLLSPSLASLSAQTNYHFKLSGSCHGCPNGEGCDTGIYVDEAYCNYHGTHYINSYWLDYGSCLDCGRNAWCVCDAGYFGDYCSSISRPHPSNQPSRKPSKRPSSHPSSPSSAVR